MVQRDLSHHQKNFLICSHLITKGNLKMGDWFDIGGSALGAIGSIGGGIIGSQRSSDGFSKKGAGQQAIFEWGAAPIRAQTLLKFAKRAKLHPLAVLGTGAQSQPVIQGQPGDNSALGHGVSRAMNRMGQDISDASLRNQTRQMRDLDLIHKGVQIENDHKYGELLTEQIRKERNPPAPDPQPLQNADIKRMPAEVIAGKEGAQHGSNPSEAYFSRRNPKTGTVVHFRAKGEKFTEATEEDFMANLNHNIHQGLVALTGTFIPPYNPPTHEKLKPGHVWKWSTQWPYQGWYQSEKASSRTKKAIQKGKKYYQQGGKYYPPPKKYY